MKLKLALMGAVNLYCIILSIALLLDNLTGGVSGHGDILGGMIQELIALTVSPLVLLIICIIGAGGTLYIKKAIPVTSWKFAGVKLTVVFVALLLLMTGINCLRQNTIIPNSITVYFYNRIRNSINVEELLAVYHEHDSNFRVTALIRMADLLNVYYNPKINAQMILKSPADQIRRLLLEALTSDDPYLRRTALERCDLVFHRRTAVPVFSPEEERLIYSAFMQALNDREYLNRLVAYESIADYVHSPKGRYFFTPADETAIRMAYLNEMKDPYTDTYETALMNIGKLLHETDSFEPLFYRDALLKVWRYHMKDKYYCGSSLIVSMLTAMNYRPTDFQEATPKIIELLTNKECQAANANSLRREAIIFLIMINTPEAQAALKTQVSQELDPSNKKMISIQ
jgi:hypothetical protein